MPAVSATASVTKPIKAMHASRIFRQLSARTSVRRTLQAFSRHASWRQQGARLKSTATLTLEREQKATQPRVVKPADLDRTNFRQLPSVEFWRTFRPAEGVDASKSPGSQLTAVLRRVQQGARSTGALDNVQSAAYWTYHLGRMTFFAMQGIVGLASARSSSAAAGESEGGTGRRLERLVGSGLAGPVVEALATYAADLENIRAGRYKLPWDMTTRLHRQFNPLHVLPRAMWFLQEASDTLERRDRRGATDVWLRSNLGYPDYSLVTYHYQTDGWLSARSAEVYEVSTETIFIGKQDAMQRQTLVPLAEHMAQRSPTGAGMKALEVGCGTGRFATFVKDNYPDMEMTCLDLSPFYLAKARENLQYWRSKHAPGAVNTDEFIQAAAEKIPAPDDSYDVVSCVYLFHELPCEARRAAAAEMARVLRPGGMVVLTDSVQLGDREAFDPTLGNVENFNEPYYGTYITEDLGALFMDAGLEPGTKTIASSTKSLSFTKPLAASSGAAPDGLAPAAAADTSSNSSHCAPAGRPLVVARPDSQPGAGLQANS